MNKDEAQKKLADLATEFKAIEVGNLAAWKIRRKLDAAIEIAKADWPAAQTTKPKN